MFYTIIHTFNTGADIWNYQNKENALKKFEEEKESLKRQWGYDDYEEDLKDHWEETDTSLIFEDHDYGGDDDFYESVKIKETKFEDE